MERKRCSGRKTGLMLAVLLGVMLLAGCDKQETVSFTQKKIARNDDFATSWESETATTEAGNTYYFQKDVFSTDEMTSYVRQMEEEIQKMDQCLTPKKDVKVTVYIMDSVPGDVTHADGQNLFCSVQDLEDSRYQGFLAMAHYGLGQPWIGFGIAGQIQNQEETDLTTFYQNADNQYILGLFGGNFYTTWVTKEEYTASCATATQLVAYLLKQDQADQLLADSITKEQKQDWLTSIKVDTPYDYEKEGETQGLTFSGNQYFSMVIEGKSLSLSAQQCSYLEDAQDVEEMFHEFASSHQVVAEVLGDAQSPFTENTQAIRIEAADESSGSYWADVDQETGAWVYHFNKASHDPAELGIQFSTTTQAQASIYHWYDLAFSSYLSGVYETGNQFGARQDAYQSLTGEDTDNQDDEDQNNDLVTSYKKANSLPATLEEVNMAYVYDYYALTASYDEDQVWTYPFYKYMSIDNSDRVDGDDLNLYEGCSLTSYILQNYSIKQYIDMTYNGKGAQKALGISYEDLIDQWQKYLKSEVK